MAKVGRFVTDPKVGAYCRVVLDSGEKILVNHDKGGGGAGRVSIEALKLMGLSSERLFTCDLDTPGGQATLAQLTQGAAADSVQATPIGAFVHYVTDCASVADVKARCAALACA